MNLKIINKFKYEQSYQIITEMYQMSEVHHFYKYFFVRNTSPWVGFIKLKNPETLVWILTYNTLPPSSIVLIDVQQTSLVYQLICVNLQT